MLSLFKNDDVITTEACIGKDNLEGGLKAILGLSNTLIYINKSVCLDLKTAFLLANWLFLLSSCFICNNVIILSEPHYHTQVSPYTSRSHSYIILTIVIALTNPLFDVYILLCIMYMTAASSIWDSSTLSQRAQRAAVLGKRADVRRQRKVSIQVIHKLNITYLYVSRYYTSDLYSFYSLIL